MPLPRRDTDLYLSTCLLLVVASSDDLRDATATTARRDVGIQLRCLCAHCDWFSWSRWQRLVLVPSGRRQPPQATLECAQSGAPQGTNEKSSSAMFGELSRCNGAPAALAYAHRIGLRLSWWKDRSSLRASDCLGLKAEPSTTATPDFDEVAEDRSRREFADVQHFVKDLQNLSLFLLSVRAQSSFVYGQQKPQKH